MWEKAGVGVSVVYGTMPPEAYRAAKGNNHAKVSSNGVRSLPMLSLRSSRLALEAQNFSCEVFLSKVQYLGAGNWRCSLLRCRHQLCHAPSQPLRTHNALQLPLF